MPAGRTGRTASGIMPTLNRKIAIIAATDSTNEATLSVVINRNLKKPFRICDVHRLGRTVCAGANQIARLRMDPDHCGGDRRTAPAVNALFALQRFDVGGRQGKSHRNDGTKVVHFASRAVECTGQHRIQRSRIAKCRHKANELDDADQRSGRCLGKAEGRPASRRVSASGNSRQLAAPYRRARHRRHRMSTTAIFGIERSKSS